MSEPITLYRGDETLTVYAPSWAKELQSEGWTLEPEAGDVPFTFRETYVDETEFVNISEPAIEHVPAPAKRGRPRKAKA